MEVQRAAEVNATTIGLSADTGLRGVRIFDLVTPKKQSYSLKPRNSKNVITTAFAGPRALLFTSRRMRVCLQSKYQTWIAFKD